MWLPSASSPSGGQADTTGPKLLPQITALYSCDSRSPGKLLRQDIPRLRGDLSRVEAKASPLLGKADPSPAGVQVAMESSCLSCTDPQLFSLLCFPESRCDKDLDTLSGYALCLPNLARLQTYRFAEHRPILCVEIKVNFCQGGNGVGEKGKVGPDCKSTSHLPGVHFAHAGPHDLGSPPTPRE